jgi:DNA helicase-2/ATP-dependent DNA helicase PcrA
LGDSTLQKVERFAREKQLSLFASLEMVHEISGLPSKTVDRLRNFVELIKRYRQLIGAVSPYELASTLVDELGIFREFKQEGTIDSASRSENVRELLDAVHEFSLTHQDASLDSYLQQVSLVTDIDHWDDRANAVTLMTLHAAKGLEFAVVFITGLEDGLFPLSRSLENPHDLEEERRLFYVGATRAKDKLYLVWAKNRKRFGETRSYKSRFLKEIDLRFVDTQESYRLQRAHNDQIKISWSGEEMPAYEDFSQEYPEYSPGLRVRHEKFGKGTILKVEASTGGTKLVVLFDQGGQKRLVLPYAKLEIL